jgi:hypothetical protein
LGYRLTTTKVNKVDTELGTDPFQHRPGMQAYTYDVGEKCDTQKVVGASEIKHQVVLFAVAATA